MSTDDGNRATIMGIGVAVPEHVWHQDSFADYYFEITNSNHMVDLKTKFAKICKNSEIEKRHVCISEELLRSNPCITAYMAPSQNVRQQLCDTVLPLLGAEAARHAIADWGRQASDITHVVFCTTAAGCMPGADFELVKLLGLSLSVQRLMFYQVGCFGGAKALRVSKDLAENNPGARVLAVCVEVSTLGFRGPSESHVGNLVGQAIFGDAAGAVIIGAGAGDGGECPLFEIVSACQDIEPDTEEAVVARVCEEGIVYTLHPDVPVYASTYMERNIKRALKPIGASVDLNKDLFWVVHAGGKLVLNHVVKRLGLKEEKLDATRAVMRQYGNTMGSCVILSLNEMRRRSKKQGLMTPGEGHEWGVLFGFGPGLTVETVLLRALQEGPS